MYLLLVEDDADLAATIGEFLLSRAHTVDYAQDGQAALNLAGAHAYDVIVLDLNLPKIDGMTVCRRLRIDAGSSVPILMLTARDTDHDKVGGLEAGADDYLTKPFSYTEMHARLRALHRRGHGGGLMLQVGDLRYDLSSLSASRGERRIELTRAGLRLLEALMRISPGILTREAAQRAIWGDDPPDADASLRVHIHGLRKAIDEGERVRMLRTRHGIGYQIVDDATT